MPHQCNGKAHTYFTEKGTPVVEQCAHPVTPSLKVDHVKRITLEAIGAIVFAMVLYIVV